MAIRLHVCAGCHGARGEGVLHVAVAKQGNTALCLADPRNLIKVIPDGIRARQFTGFERIQAMPGFADKLSNAGIADLINYLRRARAVWTRQSMQRRFAGLHGRAGKRLGVYTTVPVTAPNGTDLSSNALINECHFTLFTLLLQA